MGSGLYAGLQEILQPVAEKEDDAQAGNGIGGLDEFKLRHNTALLNDKLA